MAAERGAARAACRTEGGRRGGRFVEEVSGLDTRFLYSETPTAHMHTLKIVVVDVTARAVPLTLELFTDLLAQRLDRMPALRRRRVAIPHRLSLPVWVEDADLEISSHIDWRTAPAPGGNRELADIAAEVAATPLDPDRPLWHMTVVDGMDGDRLAVIVKLHHALADGGASAAMLLNAFLTDRSHAIITPAHPEPEPLRRQLVGLAARSRARQVRNLPALGREMYTGMRAAQRASHEANGAPALPFSCPRTPLNVSLSAQRTFAMVELPIPDLLEIKASLGTTLNVVYLALCGGALRRYLLGLRALPRKTLLAGVPVGTKIDPTRLSGNHVDNMYVPLRTDLDDPVARLRAVHEAAARARRIRAAMGHEMLERRAALTPLHLYPLGLRLWARSKLSDRVRPPINVVASNVAGPREAPETDGGVISALYSVGPILEGIGLNITAWSFCDKLSVSVLGCPASLPDPWALTTQFEAELEDLRHRLGEF
ncbi:MAG: wax ester/triacylglycerol synthase family O-acyltransferase [Microthrixaceae bacterium]